MLVTPVTVVVAEYDCKPPDAPETTRGSRPEGTFETYCPPIPQLRSRPDEMIWNVCGF